MRRGTLWTVAALAAALTGCGQGEAETPAECFAGQSDYLEALEDAPGEVRLAGSVAISSCLVDDQEGGEISQISETLIGTATELNSRAQDDPAGDDTVRLGYLVGAVQEAAAATGGIHDDLVRRLDAAARFRRGEAFGTDFERAFGEGYAAGQTAG